jgi:ribosomal protein S28E/S33
VLGRLGSVGDAVMQVKVKQLTGEFAANLRAAMGGRS